MSPGVPPGDDRDVPVGGVHHGDVDRPLDHVVDVHHGRRLERLVALEPRELDDLLHHPGQPVALGEHPAGRSARPPPGRPRRRPTASARSLIAPTGVFSSWDTLATKSRRTASTRRSRVRSSTRASTSRELSGATRAVTVRGRTARPRQRRGRPRGSGRRGVPAGRARRARRRPGAGSRTSPSARAGAEALTTSSSSSTTTALLRSTESTVATPAGRTGSSCGGDRVLLALADVPRQDRAAGDDGPDERGEKRLRRGAHTLMVRSTSRWRSPTRRRARRLFTAAFTGRPRAGHLRPPTVQPCAKPSTTSSTRSSTTWPRSVSEVETSVRLATQALLDGDAEVAEQVIAADAKIDRARERVEDTAFSLLSLQQPVAGDLRVVVSALRMVSELERMGDLSVHVAKIARLRVPEIAVPEEARPTVARMGEVAEDMVRRVAAVITERDVEAAIELGRDDEEMDQLRRSSSPSCSATTGSTASRRPSTSPCSAATTSGSPTTPSRSPTGWSSWSPASTRSRPSRESVVERRRRAAERRAPHGA